MFKRIVSLLVLLFMTTSVAYAVEEFDMSHFNLQQYSLYITEEGDSGFIEPNTLTRPLRSYGRIERIDLTCDRYFSSIDPYVFIATDNYKIENAQFMLRCQILHNLNSHLDIYRVQFVVDNTYYTFDVDDYDITTGNYTDAKYDRLYLRFSKGNAELLEALSKTKNTVYVTVFGKTQDVHFDLPEQARQEISNMYSAFKAGNGLSMPTLDATPMTVQSYKEYFMGECVSIATPLITFANKSLEEWTANPETRALFTSLMTYDIFNANPAQYSDVLGYTYCTSYVGADTNGELHMALQTATKTYYAIYSSTGLELAVKQGADKLADAELEKVMAEFGIAAKKNTSDALVNSLIQQSEMVSQYNTKQQLTVVTE